MTSISSGGGKEKREYKRKMLTSLGNQAPTTLETTVGLSNSVVDVGMVDQKRKKNKIKTVGLVGLSTILLTSLYFGVGAARHLF